MKYFPFLILLLLFACNKKDDQANKKPVLTLSPVTDGLQLQLQGSATDADGKVKEIAINWGDDKG
ncbi:MAG: hypothetical protein HOO86_05595 [Bacteroidales bacterium]|nr:hypothetical protein [Bacteroidales bacterium]